MSINSWPTYEKPREKLRSQGAGALSNAELIAILFGSGCQNKDAIALARELLANYGSLQGLFQASFQSISQHTGIGLAKYAQIQAVAELNRRYLQEPMLANQQLLDSLAVKKYLIAEMRGLEIEVFACLFLDTNFRLIRFEKLSRGSINSATVHPREVVKRALTLNAVFVIAAHNHPSGNVQPSTADQELTSQLVQTLDLIEVKLADHIIVGGHKTFSFAEEGLFLPRQ